MVGAGDTAADLVCSGLHGELVLQHGEVRCGAVVLQAVHPAQRGVVPEHHNLRALRRWAG